MKKLNVALSLILVLTLVACSDKKTTTTEKLQDRDSSHVSDDQTWKEMDEFHMIMAETFHPYKDDADLGPAKAKAAELAAEAVQWAGAPLPRKVDSEAMRARLEELKRETSLLEELVAKETDQVIGAQLTRVHDIFHEIQEAWYGHEHQ